MSVCTGYQALLGYLHNPREPLGDYLTWLTCLPYPRRPLAGNVLYDASCTLGCKG